MILIGVISGSSLGHLYSIAMAYFTGHPSAVNDD